jgi:poly(hydroxyalkanoate) depolymerase family esterase
MNSDFSAAMRRATTLTQSGDLSAATAAIQDALNGRAAPDTAPAPAPEASAPRSAAQTTGPAFRIAPDVADATIIDDDAPAHPHAMPPLGGRHHMSLRNVVDTLRSGKAALDLRGGMMRGKTAAEPPLPEGAQFLSRSFSSPAGSRGYRLFIPADVTTPKGIIVMLHGCKQNPEDFATGTGMNVVAQKHGLLVIYPGQTNAHNAAACWNWFNPGDQRRDAGEPAILAGIAREVAAEHAVAPERTFVAGLSAGGAMAAVLGNTYPDVFAAVGVHSGLPVGAANDVVSAFAAMRGDATASLPVRQKGAGGPRTIIFHGSADSTVHPRNADRLFTQATGGTTANGTAQGGSVGGRTYARTTFAANAEAAATEFWLIEGAGHAWSGGNAAGSYTDTRGPDASDLMAEFFLSA